MKKVQFFCSSLTKVVFLPCEESHPRLPGVDLLVHPDPAVEADRVDEKVVAQIRPRGPPYLLQHNRRHLDQLVLQLASLL